ncbi:chromate efflux transporter [Methylobacterium sp. A54F]
MPDGAGPALRTPPGRPAEVFGAFLRLGLTAFGGPVAHLGYFREAFVIRRRWFDEAAYADIVALCQFLPGPASSQVGLAIGLLRAGPLGALAAWTAFTLPSALLLTLFAFGVAGAGTELGAGWLHGLKAVAAAVVAQAVVGMARSLAPDWPRRGLALAAAAVALAAPGPGGQVGALLLGVAAGLALYRNAPVPDAGATPPAPIGRRTALACLALCAALLVGLPLLAALHPSPPLRLAEAMVRGGALVFGGGHVVLPLLQSAMVPGFVSNDVFLAGYGAAQAVPGPLFTLAAYLGAASGALPSGWAGAALALLAIFLPSALLVFGALPFWAGLRGNRRARAALTGVNAAVVGLLLAALWTPVLTAGIRGPADALLAGLAYLALTRLRAPPWLVVGLGALAGAALG